MLEKWSRLIAGGLAIIAGLLTAALMFLTACDVFLRYSLNLPLPGTYELTEMMMCAIVFFALAYTAARGGDISLDLFVKRFSERGQTIAGIFNSLLSLGLVSLITWQVFVLANSLRLSGEKTALLSIPKYIPVGSIAVGSLALWMVLFTSLVSSLRKVTTR